MSKVRELLLKVHDILDNAVMRSCLMTKMLDVLITLFFILSAC